VTGKVHTNITLRSVRVSNVTLEKIISITYSECVFVTSPSMQSACYILYCYVAGPAVLYFSTLSPKRNFFGKKVLEHEVCV